MEASPHIRESLSKMAADILPPGHPLSVITPPPGELPQWLRVTQLRSFGGVDLDDPDYN